MILFEIFATPVRRQRARTVPGMDCRARPPRTSTPAARERRIQVGARVVGNITVDQQTFADPQNTACGGLAFDDKRRARQPSRIGLAST